MASKGKMKLLAEAGTKEPVKRRKVGFAGVAESVSCKANDCIKVIFVSSPEEMQNTFEKEDIMCDVQFAERVFGDDGLIYGYHNLEIDLWLQSNTFHAYVDIRFSKKAATGKTPTTDILSKLKEIFGDSLTEDRDAFVNSIVENSLAFEKMITEKSETVSKPWVVGSDSHNFEKRVGDEKSDVAPDGSLVKSGQIVRMELTDSAVHAWHARLNPLALFYIEGARPIIDNDPLWEVYLALEIEDGRRKITGFCNVYCFYHYPDSTRLRISQILVLPLYQGMGYGLHLLEAVNEIAIARGCYDVTMEDPSINLQKLRDTMDVLRLISMPMLQLKAQVKAAISEGIQRLHARKGLSTSGAEVSEREVASVGSSNGSRAGPSQIPCKGVKESNLLDPSTHLREDIRNRLKISKKQFKRCWEQLLFLHLDPNDKELQDVFQEGLIQRLNSELFGKDKELEKHTNKEIFDMENEYDDSKTFIMHRVSCKAAESSSARNGIEMDNRSTQPAAEDKVKALQEALSEREEDLVVVARDVARLCKRLSIPIPTTEHWLKPEAEILDQTLSGSSSPV